MKSLPFLLRFFLFLCFVLGVAFYAHSQYREHAGLAPFGDLLVPSYLIQGGLAVGIVTFLYFMRNRFKNLIGFLFIGGSLLKFIVFFLYFYPPYQADGDLNTSEFAAFFIPYGLSLIIETIFAAKMLRLLEKEDQA